MYIYIYICDVARQNQVRFAKHRSNLSVYLQDVESGMLAESIAKLFIFPYFQNIYAGMVSNVVIFTISCKPLINFTADRSKTKAF